MWNLKIDSKFLLQKYLNIENSNSQKFFFLIYSY